MAQEQDTAEYRVGKLVLEPGDILVVKVAWDMSMEDWDAFADKFKEIIPENRLLLVSGDVDISVLTPAEIEARAA